MQLMTEMSYEFVANMVRNTAGHDGMKFFPLVFSLFMFILVANLFGMFPYFFTVTSHLIVTVDDGAARVLHRHHLRLLQERLQIPEALRALGHSDGTSSAAGRADRDHLVPQSRPLSHSLRLFGNILAGHIVLKVFGGMVVALLGAGAWGIVAIAPFGMAVALTGLEFLVAALQAFVFAVLTCVYLHDAIHPGH